MKFDGGTHSGLRQTTAIGVGDLAAAGIDEVAQELANVFAGEISGIMDCVNHGLLLPLTYQ
jgi:hypothetical protein